MKYCKNCGAQLEDDAVFCATCGKRTTVMGEQAPAQVHTYAPEPPGPPKKKHNLWLLIGIPAAVVVTAAVLVFLLVIQNPMARFGKGMKTFAAALEDAPRTELSSRMAEEPFDLSTSMDLADLSEQIPQLSSGKLKFGLKADKSDGGMYLSVSQGDTRIADLSTLICGDKLYAGGHMPTDDSLMAYCIALNSQPDAPLREKLIALFNDETRQDQNKKLVALEQKLLKYTVESVDKTWFTNESATLKDDLAGITVKTSAAVLTLNAERLQKLLDTLSQKLDQDPDFYTDLDKLATSLAPGQTPTEDARSSAKETFSQAADALKQMGDSQIKILVHYRWMKPIAIEMTSDMKDVPPRVVLLKSGGGSSASYLFKMEGGRDSIPTLALRCTLDKDGDTYTCNFTVEGELDSEQFSAGLKTVTTAQKVSSSLYQATTKVSADWKASGGDEASGNVGVTFKSNIGFGTEVKPIREDKDYLFDELSRDPKQFNSIADLGNQLGAGY